GGAFTTVNTIPQNSIAAFSITDGEKMDWNPKIDMIVTHIDPQIEYIVITGFTRLSDQIVAKQIQIEAATGSIISQQESPLDSTAIIVSQKQITPVLSDELMVNEEELGFQIPSLGEILTFAIRGFFVIAGLSALFFLLLGAFAWVTSGGDQDSISAARNKIQAAIVGLLIMVAVLSLVWTLEQIIFNGKICLGLSCPLTIPSLLEPSP
ncbi:MAG TPA: hypothetical protein PLS49_01305, partial [Candidatus Woesebacteria bacterium]|nr:hypothetical protein [Candidatus Woesebacteria bacterium]